MNDNTVESPIFLRTLDDAASIRFLEPFPNVDPADKEMVKMCMVDYLFQTYSIIQEVMCDPDWSTDSPALLDDWEEYMWMAFITDYNKLNEYLPGCRRPGFTMATLLWTVNAGIALLNVRWKKSVPWREMYDEGASGLDLPYVLDHYLVLYTKPVKDHTLHELMGELFTLTTRLYETDYHPVKNNEFVTKS